MTTEAERELRPLEVEPLMRSLAVGTLSGFVAGLIGGGGGWGIAMRIVAITAGDADQGAITDAEATVGEITAGGTTFLIFLGGMAGALGGVLYLAVRRWLADAGRGGGLVFSALLLAIYGSSIIDGDNPDFDEFGSPGLNIAMFASLFIIFGLLVAPLFERIERGLPRPSLRPSDLNPDFDEFGSPGLNIAMFASLFIIFGLLVAPLFERIERGLPRPSLRP